MSAEDNGSSLRGWEIPRTPEVEGRQEGPGLIRTPHQEVYRAPELDHPPAISELLARA